MYNFEAILSPAYIIIKLYQSEIWLKIIGFIYLVICARNIIESCVHFCDNNRIIIFVICTKFVINWNKTFAMSTPRSIEFDQYIL